MSLPPPGLSVFGYCSLPPQPQRWYEKPPQRHDTEAAGPLRAKVGRAQGCGRPREAGRVSGGGVIVPRGPRGLLRKATSGLVQAPPLRFCGQGWPVACWEVRDWPQGASSRRKNMALKMDLRLGGVRSPEKSKHSMEVCCTHTQGASNRIFL